MIDNSKMMLSPEQYAKCEKVHSKINNEAMIVPLLRQYNKIMRISLALILLFEGVLSFEVFSQINPDEEGISGNILGLSGLVAIMVFHIMSIKYEESRPVIIIRRIVLALLPFFLLGMGVLLAAQLAGGIGDISESSDLDAGTAFMLVIAQDYILPNASIFILIGMVGFTPYCAFAATTLWEYIKANLEKINHLETRKNAADAFMLTISEAQKKHLKTMADIKKVLRKLETLPLRTAHKIIGYLEDGINELDKLILQQELAPKPDLLANEVFKTILGDTDNEHHLEIFKHKRDELKALDKEKILSILRA